MPRPKVDRDQLKRNAGISLRPGMIRQLDEAAARLGYPSRSALIEALINAGGIGLLGDEST